MPDAIAKSIRLPEPIWALLTEQARTEKRSVNNLVEVLIDEGMYRRLWKEKDER